jgi:ABC-2 type transport system permease protein
MIEGFLAVIVRLLAFVGKELVEVVRRPGAIVSLVLGPFLIMALFGLGYDGFRRPLQTVVVAPPESGLPQDLAAYQAVSGSGLEVIEVATDRADGEARLRAQLIDVLVVAPPDAEARFRAGEQSVMEVLINRVDPVEANYAAFLVEGLSNEVNREIIRRAAEEGQGYAISRGQPGAADIPPEVIAAPTRAELTNVAPSQPGVVAFFGPAVLALILQHLAVTLVALSLVRERTSGVIELFRISPISPWEVVAGKVLSFGVLGAVIGASTLALLVAGFGIPVLGDPGQLALVIGLLLVASLGVGLLIAVISDSERQAVQLSLLLLLASVFFSGFVLNLEEFNAPVRAVAYALPVTHGIQLTQDVMLRGTTTDWWQFGALALIAGVTLFLSWVLLRRGMTRA